MNHKKNESHINYGFSILKTILAFYVVKTHFLNTSLIKNKIVLYILGRDRSIHVPSFFNMSFYFNYRSLTSRDTKKNIKRFERLLIPYLSWPILVFSINNIICKVYRLQMQYSFKILIIQIILGNGIINPFWFQLDLMLTTFLFIVIIYTCKEYHLFILQFLMIVSYILQYSEYNYNFFKNMSSYCKMSIEREIMMIPFAITGFNFAAFNIINFLKKYRLNIFIFSIITFIFIDNFNVFNNFENYNGIKLNVLSITLILIFSSLPFEKIKSRYIKLFISFITRYTAGIFYLHIPVYLLLRFYILPIKKGTLEGVVINYLVSWIICHFGTLLFGKTKAKNLFA